MAIHKSTSIYISPKITKIGAEIKIRGQRLDKIRVKARLLLLFIENSSENIFLLACKNLQKNYNKFVAWSLLIGWLSSKNKTVLFFLKELIDPFGLEF